MKNYIKITILVISLIPFLAYIFRFDRFIDAFAFKIVFNQLVPNRLFLKQYTDFSVLMTTFFSYLFSVIGLFSVIFNKTYLQKVFLAITINISLAFFLGSVFALLFGENFDIFLHIPKSYRIGVIVIHFMWIIVALLALRFLQKNDEMNVINPNVSSKFKRLVNYVVDGVFIVISFFTIAQLGLSQILIGRFENEMIIAIWLFSIIYYVLFEYCFGASIGKFVTGTRVFSNTNVSLSFKTVLVRTLVRLIPFEPFTYLFSQNGLHDKLSDTSVKNLF